MSAARFRALSMIAGSAALLQSLPAIATEPPLAEQSFEQGRQAMASGDYARARALFEASYRAEPAIGALLNLAVCEEKLGHLNAAATDLERSLREVQADDARRPSITARLDAVRARVPHLVLRAKKPLDPSITVALDGQPIERASLGTALPIDPGHHTIRCTSPRGTACFHELVVEEQQEVEWSIVTDVPPPPAPPPRTAPRPAPPAARPKPPSPTPKSRTPLILATGAVGIVGLGVGLLGGAEVIHFKNTMDRHCSDTCDPEGLQAAAHGRTWEWVANIGFGVGVLGLGTSTYLALTARSSQRQGAELAVRGSF
jgi:hypothetical protein